MEPLLVVVLVVLFVEAFGADLVALERLKLPPELGLLADDFDRASAGDAASVTWAQTNATAAAEMVSSLTTFLMRASVVEGMVAAAPQPPRSRTPRRRRATEIKEFNHNCVITYPRRFEERNCHEANPGRDTGRRCVG